MARYYIEEDPDNPGHMTKKLICGSFLDASPIGTILDYAGSSVPAGWLACNGQAVSRSEYQFLFNVIGTTYGAGDGSTTFNVPTRGSQYDLSNPETITAAQINAGYTAQHSGWFIFNGYNENVSNTYPITVNGVTVTNVYSLGVSSSARGGYLQIPVKKGDILKGTQISTGSLVCFIAPYAKPKIIKAKLEANAGDIGLKTGIPVPDWGSAEAVTKAQISAGYTAPKDGLLIFGYFEANSTSPTTVTLNVNGSHIIAWTYSATGDYRPSSGACPICKGDVVTASSSSFDLQGCSFVPYKLKIFE